MADVLVRAFGAAGKSLCLISARIGYKLRGSLYEWRFPRSAEKLLSGFLHDTPPTAEAYADLFRYFLVGFLVRRTRLGAGAEYAGMGSYNGPAMDRLEGFSRTAPLWAAWLHGGRPAAITLADGSTADLVALLRAGILSGTNPESEEYWGDIVHWRQSIVEAADVALALWLSRAQLWDGFAKEEREQVGRWLIQVNRRRVPDNNWHLFVTQVNAVLAALGMPHDNDEAARHYARAKAFYRGAGWFRDGEMADTPGFDYYNAWGFHYHLQWLRRIAPQWDPIFIDEALAQFVVAYRCLISPEGVPMLGRSACYRMAVPVPLILAQGSDPNVVSPAEARRALDVVWQYFIRKGTLRRGNVTQGYFGPDARLLEDYSGPASCLWSLRSLVPALALPDHHPFWQAVPEPLPVERGDYRIAIEPLGWTVTGERATGVIAIETGFEGLPALEAFGILDRLRGAFSERPHRPKNIDAKYRRARYDTASPYGVGEADGR
jgi:hypothetical protein